MKTLLLRLLLLFVCLVSIDMVFGTLCEYCIKHAKAGSTQKREYSVNGTSEDILVFGSSRAFYHYVPSILKDSLGLSVYNCGLDSHGIIYAYGCISMILERYSPKLIIYDIVEDTDMYEDVMNDNQNINSLYRYSSNSLIEKYIHDYSPKESIKIKSSLYKYNESFMHIIKDYLFFNSLPQWDGYVPLIGELNESLPRVESLKDNIWGEKKRYYLSRLIETCKDKGIELIFFYSPKYYGDSPMTDQLNFFFKENNCMYVDFAKDSTFLHNRFFFHDSNHLNNIGADEYTRKIVPIIKSMVKTN